MDYTVYLFLDATFNTNQSPGLILIQTQAFRVHPIVFKTIRGGNVTLTRGT